MSLDNVKLSIKNLDLFYGDNQALKDINIDIKENKVTALIGPSGCGKSTFLRTLNRMNDLIDSVKKEGIDKTIIPVTKNGEIIDGAHRLSIALYLNLKIHFAIFDLLDANNGKDFFINRGFNQDYAKIIDKEIIKRLI